MYNDARFTARIQQLAASQTGLRPESICVNCSHTHNAPTAGFIRGCGRQDEPYLETAAHAAAATLADAWRQRQPARLSVAQGELTGMTFNRAQENGPVDPRIGVLRADTVAGRPLALAINFHSHCTAHMEIDLRAVSRDWVGEVVDQLEAAIPGATALYLQGTCGDVNFRREFNGTPRRFEPARAITGAALRALESVRPIERPGVAVLTCQVTLPTRRWCREEIMRYREEGLYRLQSKDTTGWLEGIARACVNQPERLPLRYGGSVEKAVAAVSQFAVEWSDDTLPTVDTTPETLQTEVQAIRIGDFWCAAHGSELFTSLGLELRRAWGRESLFLLGYSNGSIGYLPDAPEIARGGYAATQSPKLTRQFPFVPESGPALVQGLLDALNQVSPPQK
jgi:hypothetical protein